MKTHLPSLSMMLVAATASPLAATPDTLSSLDWMAGHWCQERDGTVIEEHWLPASGGMLIGMGRTVREGKARAFEFLRLELRDGVVTLVAQPNGEPPVPFRLVESGRDWARFDNPAHDFPKRVEYRRAGAGLHAEIGGPGADGREKVIPFDYVPCGR